MPTQDHDTYAKTARMSLNNYVSAVFRVDTNFLEGLDDPRTHVKLPTLIKNCSLIALIDCQCVSWIDSLLLTKAHLG